MAVYGITAAGFNKKTEDVILAEIIADSKKAEYFGGDDLVYDSTNPLYRQFLLMARQLADMWDLAEAAYYANDLLSANGADQNRLMSLSKFARQQDEQTGLYESDPVYLNRFLSTVSEEGFSVPVLQLKLTETSGIDFARVVENNTDLTDGNGLTPHSIHAILEKDPDITDDEFKSRIFDVFQIWKVQGIQQKGAEETTAIDINGIEQTYLYDLPTPIDVYVTYEITLAAGTDDVAWEAEFVSGIKEGCVDIIGGTFGGEPVIGKKPGVSIESYELDTPVKGIVGVVGDIVVNLAKTPTPTTKRVDIDYFEKAQTTEAKIIVNTTVTP